MKSIATLIAAVGMAASMVSVASAQDMTAADEYYNYRAAVVAYERCNDLRLSEEDALAVESRITQLLPGFVSPGLRLSLIEEAKEEFSALANANICARTDALQDALDTFESDLASALTM